VNRIDSDGDGVIEIYDKNETKVIKINAYGESYFTGGLFGLGTNNPQRLLHMEDEVTSQVGITIQTSDTATGILEFKDTAGNGAIIYDHSDDSMTFKCNGSNRITIDSAGDVGIGTDNPQQPLHLRDSAPIIRLEDSDNGIYSEINQNTGAGALAITADVAGLGVNPSLDLRVASNTRIKIDSDGYVGIGTTSPDGRLHVYSDSAGTVTPDSTGDELILENSSHVGMTMLSPDANFSSIYFGSPSNSRGARVDWCHDNLELTVGTRVTGGKLRLLSNSEDVAMTIDDSGQVGIGITAPEATLQVVHGTTAGGSNQGGVRIGRTSSQYWDFSGDAASNYLTVGGKPSYIGTHDANSFYLRTNDTNALYIDTNQYVYMPNLQGSTGENDLRYNVATGEVFYDTSALKYKQNIRDNPDTSWIYNVPVVMYDRKDSTRVNEIGIIADVLEKVAPAFCSYNEHGEVESYNKSDLVPVLLAEIQKHENRIKHLETRLLQRG
jgi:hypothetical protein